MTDTSFGFILVWNDKGTDRYLLIKSSRAGVWGFPKGHAEKGETEIQAALREVFEETGVKDVEVIEGFSFIDEYTFERDGTKNKKAVKLFAGQVKDPSVTIQEKEIADYKWATYEEALKTFTYEGTKIPLKRFVENKLEA